MEKFFLFFIMLFPLFYCQFPLNEFKSQFLLEINKFKPKFEDKALEKIVNKIAKTFLVQSSYTNKVVDLNNILKTCHLDFEINLVKSETLPASNHLINHIIVGGLIRPGMPNVQNKNDLWHGNVGVVLKKDEKTVYSLLYNLSVHFDKNSFIQKSGIDLSDVNERVLVNAIFYNKCLELMESQMSPIEIDVKEPIKI